MTYRSVEIPLFAGQNEMQDHKLVSLQGASSVRNAIFSKDGRAEQRPGFSLVAEESSGRDHQSIIPAGGSFILQGEDRVVYWQERYGTDLGDTSVPSPTASVPTRISLRDVLTPAEGAQAVDGARYEQSGVAYWLIAWESDGNVYFGVFEENSETFGTMGNSSDIVQTINNASDPRTIATASYIVLTWRESSGNIQSRAWDKATLTAGSGGDTELAASLTPGFGAYDIIAANGGNVAYFTTAESGEQSPRVAQRLTVSATGVTVESTYSDNNGQEHSALLHHTNGNVFVYTGNSAVGSDIRELDGSDFTAAVVTTGTSPDAPDNIAYLAQEAGGTGIFLMVDDSGSTLVYQDDVNIGSFTLRETFTGLYPISRPYRQLSGVRCMFCRLIVTAELNPYPRVVEADITRFEPLSIPIASRGALIRDSGGDPPQELDIEHQHTVVTSLNKSYMIMPLRVATVAQASSVTVRHGFGIMSVDHGKTQPEARARLRGTTYFGSGVVHQVDPVGVGEVGFVFVDAGFSDAAVGSGSLTGAFAFAVVFTYQSGNGDLIRSEPLNGTRTLTSQDLRISWKAPMTKWPARDVKAEIYVSEANGSVPYLHSIVDAATETIDIDSAGNPSAPALYTFGGELADEPAPAPFHLSSGNDRLFLIPQGARYEVWPSKPFGDGFAPQFNESLKIRLGSDLGPAVATSVLDEKIIVLRERGAEYFVGDGPDALGNGSFQGPFEISADTGCISPESVTSDIDGVYFQSERGVHRINRGLQIEFIGALVRTSTRGKTLVGAQVFPKINSVLWCVREENLILMWNYEFQRWAEWRVAGDDNASHKIIDATLAGGTYHLLVSNGSNRVVEKLSDLFEDSGFVWADYESPLSSPAVELSYRTSWIKPGAGNISFGRFRTLQVLGERRGQHGLKAEFEYDFRDAVVDSLTIPKIDVAASTIDGDYTLQFRSPRRRLRAMRVRITGDQSENSNGSAGLTLSSLMVEVEAIRGGARVQKAGKA